MSHHDPRLTMLSPREQAILAAVGNAFFPPDGPIPVSGVAAGVVSYFDRYVARAGRLQRLMMRLLFTFIDLSPFTFGPRRRRFVALSQAERIHLLDGMAKSRIYFRRVSFISIRALMTMAYLSNAEVARAMKMEPDADPFDLVDRELEDEEEAKDEGGRGSIPGAGATGGAMMEAAQ